MADIRSYLPTSVLRQLADEGYRVVKIEEYQPDLSAGIEGDEYMSQADNAVLTGLEEKIAALALRIEAIEERLGGKDLSQELYGETPDHAADRAARAAFQPRVKPR